MNAQVVCVSSREPHEPYYHWQAYKMSLHRFGEIPTNIGEGQEWRGLMTKPYLLREWLRRGDNTSDRLLVTDAWDIVFTEHPHGVGDRCQSIYGDKIVFNGEKGCWPREDLRDAFPDTGSPWRFLNSGFMAGPADKILALLEAMPIEQIGFDPPGGPYPNDQGEYQELFAKKARSQYFINDGFDLPDMVIDSECLIAQTLSACDLEEFDFDQVPFRNRVTNTVPGVWHGNGSGKNIIMPTIFARMNI